MTGGIDRCCVPGCDGLACFGYSIPRHVADHPGTLWACLAHRPVAEARRAAKMAELGHAPSERVALQLPSSSATPPAPPAQGALDL